MIRLLLIIIGISLFSFRAKSQDYGNEWINYSQQYYKFKIISTGIQRISYDDLMLAGIPVGSFTHENIQVFGREAEIPLWFELNGDGVFNSGDYFLFYAVKNDGWLDSKIYQNPANVSNPAYSLFNDQVHYFFTWNNTTNNLRFQEVTDTDYTNYAPKDYVWSKFEQSFTSNYLEGEKIASAVSSSFYVDGEGYGGSIVEGVNGFTQNYSAGTIFPYQGVGAPDARFLGLTTTASNAEVAVNGDPNHHLRWQIGGNTVYDELAFGNLQLKASLTFPSSYLSNTTNLAWTIVGDLPVDADKQSLTYYSITYPRIPTFNYANNFTFEVENSVQNRIRIDFENVSIGNPILFAIGNNPQKLLIQPDGGVYKTLLENSGSGLQQLVLEDLSNTIPINLFEPVNGTGTFTDFSTHNFEDAALLIYHPSMTASVQEYKLYREGISGGGYNVELANIEELYLQFGGGVEKHPIAMRRFASFAFDHSTQKPQSLFLIGKGISNLDTRNNATYSQNNLIPSFGYPGSDICLTAGLPGTTNWSPLIPTGRISVNTDAGLLNYLSKIEEYESLQDQGAVYNSQTKDWQKHAIHLVGGTDVEQQYWFQTQMNNMRDKFEDSIYYGGTVHNIARSSDDPIPPGQLNAIMDRIENGVSLMTYYGHYGIGGSGFEINLDDVANWNNQGKYPLMLVNSCYNGNIFSPSLGSSSEYFVNAENNGAIGYISSVSTGFHPIVGYYSNHLYNEFARLGYGEPIGLNMKKAIQSMEPNDNTYYEVTATQMLLNGDPLLKLNNHDRPEIELTENNVSFLPNEIDLNTDSIEMTIVVKNLGRAFNQNYTLEIRRDFPGTNFDSLYFIERNGLYYTDTIKLKLPLQPNIAVGLNSFDIKVDIPNFIDEQYDELSNNQIVKQYFLNVDGILPAAPYDFAVVPNDSVTVVASTVNPIADFNTYRFQLDTTDAFNSPFLRNAVVSGLGGVKKVNPSDWDSYLQLQDSVVYFWRVAIDETNPNWSERSFQYISGKSGWGQDHFFQFKKNSFWNIDYNKPDRLREMNPDSIQIRCDVFNNPSYDNAWYVEGTMQDYATCGNLPSLHVAVFDPTTLESWGTNYAGANPDHDFGNIMGCRGRVEKYFVFRQTSLSQLQAFQNMVLNEVPDSFYLLIYTPIETSYNMWNALDSVNMYQTFQTLGSTNIVPGLPNNPFIFFTKKGAPSTVAETYVDVALGQTSAQLTALAIGSSGLGQETSTLIGPSYKWGNVYWKQDSIDLANNADTTRLLIQAFNWQKQFVFETNQLFTSNDSIIDLNPIIDANLYPYIRLKALYKDTTNFTPAQIDRWHVLYDHVPEAAIDGSNGFTWTTSSDSLIEGQDVAFAIDVRNIFDIDMDSLLVNYWIEDQNHVKHPIPYARRDSLRVPDILRDTITFSTVNLAGQNSLWMEINPYINGSSFITDQPEQEHFNNILQIPFYVLEDDENPLLDVTFDGRHILNGDIVNPASEVYITLKDDNEFLIMDDISDTTLFGVYLTDPTGVQRRIPFMDGSGNTVMQWIPAESQNKRFKIIYPAAFQLDGKYKLLVQGSDRSGNLSGDLQYEINFEVVHASTITQMMNYPNPFSTSTRFVFTLTGSEVPDEILIRIMTVSGRVVREITEDEIGQIYIGRNITEYAWDGRDEFGDPLANGVYLYTVQVQINGENIEQRESGADQYFKKNFGKMYLMR